VRADYNEASHRVWLLHLHGDSIITLHSQLGPAVLPVMHGRKSPDARKKLEAATGVEPVMEVLQTSALPLGYAASA
jgi:hypothetical protein